MHPDLSLVIPFAIAAAVYLLVPLGILATFRIATRITLTPTRVEDLAQAARHRVALFLATLGRQGFIVVSNTRLPGAVPGVLGVQIMLVQAESRDVAYGMFSSAASGAIRDWGLTLRTYFDDGTQIVTATSSQRGSFPANPAHDAVALHWIRDPEALYAVHRARVLASGRANEPRLLPEPGAEIAFQTDEWSRELHHVEQAGYFRPEADGAFLRLTVKGAYLMTWRVMWPGKWIRGARQRHRARQVLRRLRAAGYDVPV